MMTISNRPCYTSFVDIPSFDLEIFQGLQAKQPQALEMLYDTYADQMYGLALYILKDAQDAEDLIHEIFLTQWNACSFDPNRGTLKTYLLLLVRSRALDRLRSNKTRREILVRSSQSGAFETADIQPLESAVSDEQAQRVKAALAELPENQRKALLMAYFEGLTQQEIAQQLNVPVGTVKSWFRLGFNKLRQSLKDFVS